MDRSEVLERVIKVASSHLKVNPEDITEASEFAKDLGADSVKSIELVALFENEFDIEMDEEEALKVRTIGDAADFVMKYL